MLNAIQSADEAILLFIQENLRSGFLTPIMKFFTHMGEVGAVWLIMAVLFIVVGKKYRLCGVNILLAIAVCFVINNLILKNLIARERPFFVIENLMTIIEHPDEFSFPSGHASSSFAAAYAITRGVKKGWLAYILAALIAVSRIYFGVHYLTDILAGAIIGTLAAMAVCFVVLKLYRGGKLGFLKINDAEI